MDLHEEADFYQGVWRSYQSSDYSAVQTRCEPFSRCSSFSCQSATTSSPCRMSATLSRLRPRAAVGEIAARTARTAAPLRPSPPSALPFSWPIHRPGRHRRLPPLRQPPLGRQTQTPPVWRLERMKPESNQTPLLDRSQRPHRMVFHSGQARLLQNPSFDALVVHAQKI